MSISAGSVPPLDLGSLQTAAHGIQERGEDGEPPVKRTRFSPMGTRYTINNLPIHLTLARYLPRDAFEALLVRLRLDEINQALISGKLWTDEEDARRSPSPPPKYDSSGKRTNTREQRIRDKLTLERQKLIQDALQFSPVLKQLPVASRPAIIKKTNKIRIPIDEYPTYNFMGVLIGPRGDTHKMLERTTGAKISIRGKGSTKDGQIILPKQSSEDDDEPLHVLIVADTQEQLDKATAEIEKLLVPIDDSQNPHKAIQLRKLAEYNGTLRPDWGVAKEEKVRRFASAEIKCEFCGETSHPTKDCPIKAQPGAKSRMDKEYESFMNELGSVAINSTAPEAAEPVIVDALKRPRSRSPSPPPPSQGFRGPPSRGRGGIGPWTIPSRAPPHLVQMYLHYARGGHPAAPLPGHAPYPPHVSRPPYGRFRHPAYPPPPVPYSSPFGAIAPSNIPPPYTYHPQQLQQHPPFYPTMTPPLPPPLPSQPPPPPPPLAYNHPTAYTQSMFPPPPPPHRQPYDAG